MSKKFSSQKSKFICVESGEEVSDGSDDLPSICQADLVQATRDGRHCSVRELNSVAVENSPEGVADREALVQQGEEDLPQFGGHGGAVGRVEPDLLYIYIYDTCINAMIHVVPVTQIVKQNFSLPSKQHLNQICF